MVSQLLLAVAIIASSCTITSAQTPDLPSVSLPVLASSPNVESDKVTVHYGSTVTVIGNDGSADKGGFHIYDPNASLTETSATITGRTKVVTVVHGLDEKDYLVTFSVPEHTLRFYDLETGEELEESSQFILAEFSALCAWNSPVSGSKYIFLFGKKEVRMYILTEEDDIIQAVEVMSFTVPIEAETCTAPVGDSVMMFGGFDKKIYTFAVSDMPGQPTINTAGETEEEIVGSAVYQLAGKEYVYLVGFEESIGVFSQEFAQLGLLTVDGGEDLELGDLAIHQGASSNAPQGFIAYAFESDEAGKTFGISSLESIFEALNLTANTDFNPADDICPGCSLPECDAMDDCDDSGFCSSENTCICYSGFAGSDCSEFQCQNDCSGQGKCVGANQCQCDAPFTGDDCAILSVSARFETDANGADGDDPAIWIAPVAANSRIITTTKSEESPGLSVFDLQGNKLQSILAEEPNNVDVLYGFPISANETIDLAYAGCRGDDTLCLFKIDQTGTISEIPGGVQNVPADFKPYGSCAYRRARDNKFFIFVNSKKAQYLQFELGSANGTITTTLVREFSVGTGTQPEGCVVDDENEVIFVGEEAFGLWRYGANPEDSTDAESGVLVDQVDKAAGGKLNADVEGLTLIYGKDKDHGFIMVSTQGVSAYNVYRRAEPHQFVMTFSIGENKDLGIDAVTNTDGITAVGTNLGLDFPHGLLVVHDDANQKPDKTTDAAASFKLVSLADVLDASLLADVNEAYDPRPNWTTVVRKMIRGRSGYGNQW